MNMTHALRSVTPSPSVCFEPLGRDVMRGLAVAEVDLELHRARLQGQVPDAIGAHGDAGEADQYDGRDRQLSLVHVAHHRRCALGSRYLGRGSITTTP